MWSGSWFIVQFDTYYYGSDLRRTNVNNLCSVPNRDCVVANC